MIGNYLTPKLPTWTIPITRGADRTFTLVCRVAEGGAETDWNAAVFMDIDTKPVATRVDAVVAGSRATFTVEWRSLVCAPTALRGGSSVTAAAASYR